FCRKLTELSGDAGDLPNDWEFRLPTEAQWEYACRAGTTTATAFGDKLSSKQANFKGKPYNGAEAGPSLGRAAKVGSYPANAWGLHDMHGNTYEWCRDWYHAKLPGGVDPDLYSAKSTALKNRTGDVSRARRGGCWSDEGWPCRSAFRLRFEPERRYDHIGFRVVAVRPESSPSGKRRAIMLTSILVPILRERFPGRGLVERTPPDPCAVFPGIHPGIRGVSIYDEGDELIVCVDDITHGHFAEYDDQLPDDECERRIVEAVVEFLDAL